MNKEYFDSIVSLYLNRETDKRKTSLNIVKREDQIEFNFNMNKTNEENTSFMIPFDVYSDHVIDFINQYKDNLMIIDEKYDYNNTNQTCYYYVLFKNGRNISFNGFTIFEMNNIRNILYGININKEELRVNHIKDEKQMAYKPRLNLQQTGFTSYATLFLSVLLFISILVIVLFVINTMVN